MKDFEKGVLSLLRKHGEQPNYVHLGTCSVPRLLGRGQDDPETVPRHQDLHRASAHHSTPCRLPDREKAETRSGLGRADHDRGS